MLRMKWCMKHNRNNEHKHEIHQRRNLNQQTDEKAKRVEAKEAKEAKWVQLEQILRFRFLSLFSTIYLWPWCQIGKRHWSNFHNKTIKPLTVVGITWWRIKCNKHFWSNSEYRAVYTENAHFAVKHLEMVKHFQSIKHWQHHIFGMVAHFRGWIA